MANDVQIERPRPRPPWGTASALGRPQRGDALQRAPAGAVTIDSESSLAWDTVPAWETQPGVERAHDPARYSVSRRRDSILRGALAVADVVDAYLALFFVVTFLGHGSQSLRLWALLVAPFVVVVGMAIGLYDRDQHVLRKTTIDEVPSILHLSLLYALTAWLAEALLIDGRLGRPQVLALTVVSFVFFAVGRSRARALVRRVASAERCLVLGNAATAERIAEKLADPFGVNATLLGRVALDADDRHTSSTARVLGDTGALARVIAEHGVERVIIAPDGHDQEEILYAIRLIKAMGAKVSVLPRLLEVVGSSSTFDDVHGITLLGVRQYGLSKSSEFLKRTMDIVGSAIGLVLFSPLLLVLAIAIKLDTRGPVFFRQPRIGRRGERFNMFKFRSMVRDAEDKKGELRERNEVADGLFKISDDPRITRVGRFLRRTSLDELPQLLNVLEGKMSLVGPRPFVPEEDSLIQGWERRRLIVRPGMTGLWQICGSSRVPKREMVKIDYLYGANWSMWLDLKILLRTVPYVVHRRGL